MLFKYFKKLTKKESLFLMNKKKSHKILRLLKRILM